jgi:cytochrome c oxidase subunit 3
MSTADEPSEDHGGHHLPAVEDWPRGFGEASWWPFVAAIGASGIYVGIALLIMGYGDDPVIDPMIGQVAVVGAVGTFLVGLYGWLYHAFIVNFWEHGTDGHGSAGLKFGMVLFLGSEIATFGAGFMYYFFYRSSGAWTTEGLPHLVGSLVIVNTLILVASSVTLHIAHVRLRQGNRESFIKWLGITLLAGIVFIGGQVYEYYEFIEGEGFTLTQGAYANAFYGLTGLHGLHVSLGAVLLGIVFVRALMGQYSADRHTSVSTASMYWHFVDVVWIFLVVVLYVGAGA